MKLIGTDSKVYREYIRFCTCTLDLETGLLKKVFVVTKPMHRMERLIHEAVLTIAASEGVGRYELHFDFSPDPRNKSYPAYQAFHSFGKCKPEAFMATSVADYFLEH